MEELELTSAQKAAAILVAIGKPAAGRLLKFFKQDELKTLIEGARKLKTIPQDQLERIVGEFEDEFAAGAGLLDSADTMDTLLTENLSQDEMNAILGREQNTRIVEDMPPWEALEDIDAEELAAYLAGEHPQTVAYVVSNLSSALAARILLTLPKDIRGEAVKRMLSMGPVSATARRMIEQQVRERFLATVAGKSSKEGRTKVVGLLNELEKPDIDVLMGELEAVGTSDLEAIRAQIFSFEDLVQLSQKARVALFDGFEADVVTTALRTADPVLVEAVLSAIGARTRRMIESELAQDSDNVTLADITRARRTISSKAIQMANEGAIELPSVQDAA